MRLKQSLQNSASRSYPQRGVSLIEFMVAIGLAALIGGMIISIAISNRATYQRDIIRTRVNQNARAALDIIGTEVRQAGERLPSTFPAIELLDNGTTAADELILRRNLLDDSLVGCSSISAGTITSAIPLSRSSPLGVPCTYPNQRVKMTAWSSYASAISPRPLLYLFNQSTRNGEFARLDSSVATDTGSLLRLNVVTFTPQFAYTQEATSAYVLNEWRFRVVNGTLQIVENRDTTNPKNVIDQVSNFQVELIMNDGSTQTALSQTGAWTTIQRVRVTVTAQETTNTGQIIDKVLSSDFFPRNILST